MTHGTLPLAGVRVLDLSRLLPGGCCSLLLADHGAAAGAIFASRTRERWGRFAGEVERCPEPVFDLDEALASEYVAARGMVSDSTSRGWGSPWRRLGAAVGLSRTPPDTGTCSVEHTEEVLRSAGYGDARIAALLRSGAVAGPYVGEAGGSFLA